MKISVLIPNFVLDFLRSTSTRYNYVLEAILVIHILVMNVLLVTRLLKSFWRSISSKLVMPGNFIYERIRL